MFMITNLTFERVAMEDTQATYEFQGMNGDEPVTGLFELNLKRYMELESEGSDEALHHALYWLSPIQSDAQYWAGMRLFFRIYKHYLEQGTYIEQG